MTNAADHDWLKSENVFFFFSAKNSVSIWLETLLAIISAYIQHQTSLTQLEW